MPIRVRYFGSIRETVPDARSEISVDQPATLAEVWLEATGTALPADIYCARNHEHCDIDTPVEDGDEVAFFPPVTGG